MELIDIGANLTHESFAHDLAAVLDRARAAEVTQLVLTGSCEASSRAAAALAQLHPRVFYATAGLHPHNAQDWDNSTAATFMELAATPEVVALGEMGLDFNRDFSPRPSQEMAFSAQLELATELGLPVFLHERDAHERFAAILRRYRHRLPNAVLHCFTGNDRELAACLDLDLHVGITGWICDERRGLHLRELVSSIPLDRLMIETDAPYLLPRDMRPRPKSRRNEPAFLPHILNTVASCLDLTAEELARITTENARRFFALAAPEDIPTTEHSNQQ